MYKILFNNGNNIEYKLGIEKYPNIPISERVYEITEIEGRDGSLTDDKEYYKDIEISIDFNATFKEDFYGNFRRIKNWLFGDILDKKLIFNDDIGYYRIVKQVKKANDIEVNFKTFGRFTATFVCEPFSYLLNNQIVTLNTPKSLYNTAYRSKPTIKVYGQGDIELNVNDTDIKLTDVKDYIVLNSTTEDAYRELTENMNNNMSGEFPIFRQGQNNINWTGNVTKLEITPNWRWL